VNVGELQRKFSTWAEQDKNRKFYDLFPLLSDGDWIRLAHDNVAQNAGSITAGCDGINMRLFDEQLEENLQKLGKELQTETFEPYPVRRVYIPKPDGRRRPLGIPTIKDRIVQEALRMILEPIYEADFSQYSYGFRPNRCTMDAITRVMLYANGNKKFYWVIEGDISSYFDTISHRKLLQILRRRIKDEKLLKLIWKFLRAGVMEKKLFRDTTQGTPQGGIVSPLLANIYLQELDRYMERYTELSKSEKAKRRRQGLGNYAYVRYADDFVVLSNGTKEQVEALRQELYEYLKGHLRLTLSLEKTKVTHLKDGFRFLGFWIQRQMGAHGMVTKLTIPTEARKRIRNKVAEATDKSTHEDSAILKLVRLNQIIGGWCRYYQYTSRARHEFNNLAHTAFWAYAHWLGRKFQHKMPEVMRRFRRGNTLAIEKTELHTGQNFPTLRYKKWKKIPNPYTTQTEIVRETLQELSTWTRYERTPGMGDLRPEILKRDGYQCCHCGTSVTEATAEIDHIKPVRKFKLPVNANVPNNLQTLCKPCHRGKTKMDRQAESRVR
jgi:group II intron reverse transcriptase/maturase